jgi:hypothetical protein
LSFRSCNFFLSSFGNLFIGQLLFDLAFDESAKLMNFRRSWTHSSKKQPVLYLFQVSFG